MQMKSKAKRIDNGEWVEGWYEYDPSYETKHWILEIHERHSEGFSNNNHDIDPKTLCQQVRGTEFFEGDEVEMVGDNRFGSGFIEWSDEGFGWRVVHKEGLPKGVATFHSFAWKPTGRNIFDT